MAEWKISNDTPYLDEFPTLYQITEYPNALWRQVNGELPYKTCFSEMFDISDVPAGTWRISDDLPYKKSFPLLIKFTDVPHNMWVVSEGNELPYKLCFPPLYPPRKEKKPKYKTFPIILYDYHETITIRKDVK